LDPVVCLQVDAFTDRPFSGNPAAVCLLEEGRDSEWMQAVAAEMNLSETAFVWPVGDGFDLRWFTPAVEVDLCGHATLAAAHALWSEGLVPGEGRISFRTRSGLLTAARRGDLIELDFPATVASPANLQADQSREPGEPAGGSDCRSRQRAGRRAGLRGPIGFRSPGCCGLRRRAARPAP
jgi:predicted PhzF superfamily epimerase YddE/YHI9